MADRPHIALTARTLPIRAASRDRPTETVTRSYIEALEAAGGLAWLLPSVDAAEEAAAAYLDRVDGLLLTGGDDPHPHLFGEEPHPRIELVDERRDRFEIALVHEARRRDLPVFGICRGIQMMNVALGGDIYQDIASQSGSTLQHTQRRADDGPWHRIAIEPGSRLAAIVGSGPLAVNSFHHQSCRKVAEGLTVSATAVADGLIEALEGPDSAFFLGVQWHPELGANRGEPASQALFRAFVNAARKRAGNSSH